MDGESGVADLFGLLFRQLRPQQGVVMHLHLDRSGHIFDDAGCLLLLVSEKWIEKFRLPDILPEFAVLKEHMHGFP